MDVCKLPPTRPPNPPHPPYLHSHTHKHGQLNVCDTQGLQKSEDCARDESVRNLCNELNK